MYTDIAPPSLRPLFTTPQKDRHLEGEGRKRTTKTFSSKANIIFEQVTANVYCPHKKIIASRIFSHCVK